MDSVKQGINGHFPNRLALIMEKRLWITIIVIVIIVLAELITHGPATIIEIEAPVELAVATLEIEPVDFTPKAQKATTSALVAPKATGDCATEITKYNWSQTAAYNVMMIESTNNPGVVNDNPSTRDYSIGCFQINLYGGNARTRPSQTWLSVAENNVAYAYGMWKAMGTFCSTGGWYNTCTKLGYHGIY